MRKVSREGKRYLDAFDKFMREPTQENAAEKDRALDEMLQDHLMTWDISVQDAMQLVAMGFDDQVFIEPDARIVRKVGPEGHAREAQADL